MSQPVFVDVRSDADVERFVAAESEAFGESLEEGLREYRAMLPHAVLRMGCVDDQAVAGYSLMPAGQFLGGRSVGAECVTSVFVHPAWRRRGIAGALLRDLVDVARVSGTAIAPLYASTTRLYRRWGWEVGDRTLVNRVRADALSRFRGEGQARRNPDRAAVEAMRRAHLHRFDGPLDRPDWWLAVQWDTEATAHERCDYGWFEDETLTGFVRYKYAHPVDWSAPGTIDVYELVATTVDALHGLFGLVGSHESQAGDVVFKRAAFPGRDLLYLLPDVDKAVAIRGSVCWMQRIIDVSRAVEQRGWRAGIDARLELEVSDPCEDGATRLVLEVASGRGHATVGGAGGIRCGIGALSVWYSSRLRASDASRLGLLEGPPGDIETMDALVGDRPTWAPDYF